MEIDNNDSNNLHELLSSPANLIKYHHKSLLQNREIQAEKCLIKLQRHSHLGGR